MDIKGIHITVTRDNKIKNTNISVLPPDGRVVVSAPEHLDDSDIKALVISKLPWIKKSRQKIADTERETQREMESNESHYFLGTRYRLKVIEQSSGAHSVKKDGDWLIMTVQKGTSLKNRRELLWEFYREQLKQIVGPMIEKKAKEYNEENVTWEIRRMRTEWGSCMHRRRHILLNLELARVPMDCIEYIVIHELTHLQVNNHGEAFVALMNQRMPMWRQVRKELDKFPATHYDYTPDWLGEIGRLSNIANDVSIINLSMLESVLSILKSKDISVKEDYIITPADKELAGIFDSVNPLTNIDFEKAIDMCGDTEYYTRDSENRLAIKSLWLEALSDIDTYDKVNERVKTTLGNASKEYAGTSSVVIPIVDFDDNVNGVQAKYSDDKLTLIRVSKDAVSFEVPEGTRVIGQAAFADCTSLIDVKLPQSLVRIEAGAFLNCSSLEDISVPLSVMKVGTDAFKGTLIDASKISHIYSIQGYFTPSSFEGLPKHNIFVYANDGFPIANEIFGAKPNGKNGKNGRAYYLPHIEDSEQYIKSVESFLAYVLGNEDKRFILSESLFSKFDNAMIADIWMPIIDIDNVIMPYRIFCILDEAQNEKVRIDPVAKYRFGGIINFSYIVNAIKLFDDPEKNARVQKLITDYNQENVKPMLFPLCKRYKTGMSIHSNDGLYIGDGDQYYDEGSFEVKIIGVRSTQLQKIAREICSLFVQESVLVKDESQNHIYFLYAPIMDIRKHPALLDCDF